MLVTPLYEGLPRLLLEDVERLPIDHTCTRCPLAEGAHSVCIGPRGAPKGVLLIGEHPGAVEDKRGLPFVGASGNLLEDLVDKTLGKDYPVAFDNAVRCDPKGVKLTDKHLSACRPYLADVLARVNPERVVLLGGKAMQSFLGRSPSPTVSRRGFTRLSDGRPVMFCLHPAAALYNDLIAEWFQEDLVWALTAQPPYPVPTDVMAWSIQTVEEAEEAYAEMVMAPWFSYDVEAFGVMFTDTYKLVSVSVQGRDEKHIWFWDYQALRDERVLPLKRLMADEVARKCAYNAKYDLLAIRQALGVVVRGFELCPMTARSMLDTNAAQAQSLEEASEVLGMGGHKKEQEIVRASAEQRLTLIYNRQRDARKIKDKAILKEEKRIRSTFSKKREQLRKKKQPDLAMLALYSAAREEIAVQQSRRTIEQAPDAEIEAARRELLQLHPLYPEDQNDTRAVEKARLQNEQDVTVAVAGLEKHEGEKFSFLWTPPATMLRYNARDTLACTLIGKRVEEGFQRESDIGKVWDNVMRRATSAAVQVETWGVPISRDALRAFRNFAQVELDRVALELKGYGNIDWASPDQLGKLLYEDLKLPVLKRTATKAPSTDKETLVMLSRLHPHPVLAHIQRWRRMSKMLSTYVAQIENGIHADGRIHPWLKLDGAATGRFSCTEPNLQNIPRPDTEEGRMARDLFCAFEGHSLVELDFSQVELRVAAALSGDPKMRQIFLDGVDYHQRTAELISRIAWNMDPKDVKSPQRSLAKCFHPDTEVLTRTGWRKISLLHPGEEVVQATPGEHHAVRLEWVVPLEVFTMKHPSGKLVHLQNEGMDLRVTPDHRMLVWRAGGTPKVVMPDEVPRAYSWANAGRLEGGWSPDETLLRLAVAAQADGSYDTSGALRWGFSKERKIARLRSLLNQAGIDYREGVQANAVRTFRVTRKAAEGICALLEDKKLPWSWLTLTESLREAVLDEVPYWDGHQRVDWRAFGYYSVDPQNADVLQALAACTGRKTRLAVPHSETQTYRLTVRDKAHTRGGNLSMQVERYDAEVACLSVPSSFVLVRDGQAKVPVITGQTFNFALLYGQGDKTIADNFGCTEEEAARVRAAILGEFHYLAEWLEREIALARKTGCAFTYWWYPGESKPRRARRRWMIDVKDKDKKKRSAAERATTNNPVQGTAADLCNDSFGKAVEWLLDDCVEAELVLPIHDSLLFHTKAGYEEEVAYRVKAIMEDHSLGGVPVVAEVKTGKSLGSLKKAG